MHELVSDVLQRLDRLHHHDLRKKYVVRIEGRNREDRYVSVGQRFCERIEHTDRLERDLALYPDPPPSCLLLDVVRGHEFGRDYGELIIRPHHEAHFPIRYDLGNIMKNGKFAYRKLLLKQLQFELFYCDPVCHMQRARHQPVQRQKKVAFLQVSFKGLLDNPPKNSVLFASVLKGV